MVDVPRAREVRLLLLQGRDVLVLQVSQLFDSLVRAVLASDARLPVRRLLPPRLVLGRAAACRPRRLLGQGGVGGGSVLVQGRFVQVRRWGLGRMIVESTAVLGGLDVRVGSRLNMV